MATSPRSVRAGGLPPPELLAEYEKVVPGSAQRILDAFEKQSEHRRVMEVKAQEAQIADTRRGQIFGLIIGLTAILIGSATAIYGSELAGGFIGGGGVIGLVSVFVLGRYMGAGRGRPRNSQRRRVAPRSPNHVTQPV
jgi:uncharacterized membrane protein